MNKKRPPGYMDFSQYFALNADNEREIEQGALEKFNASMINAKNALGASTKEGALSGDPTKTRQWNEYTAHKIQAEKDLKDIGMSQSIGDPRLRALRESMGTTKPPMGAAEFDAQWAPLEGNVKAQSSQAYQSMTAKKQAEQAEATRRAQEAQAESRMGPRSTTTDVIKRLQYAEARYSRAMQSGTQEDKVRAYRELEEARAAANPQTI